MGKEVKRFPDAARRKSMRSCLSWAERKDAEKSINPKQTSDHRQLLSLQGHVDNIGGR